MHRDKDTGKQCQLIVVFVLREIIDIRRIGRKSKHSHKRNV